MFLFFVSPQEELTAHNSRESCGNISLQNILCLCAQFCSCYVHPTRYLCHEWSSSHSVSCFLHCVLIVCFEHPLPYTCLNTGRVYSPTIHASHARISLSRVSLPFSPMLLRMCVTRVIFGMKGDPLILSLASLIPVFLFLFLFSFVVLCLLSQHRKSLQPHNSCESCGNIYLRIFSALMKNRSRPRYASCSAILMLTQTAIWNGTSLRTSSLMLA